MQVYKYTNAKRSILTHKYYEYNTYRTSRRDDVVTISISFSPPPVLPSLPHVLACLSIFLSLFHYLLIFPFLSHPLAPPALLFLPPSLPSPPISLSPPPLFPAPFSIALSSHIFYFAFPLMSTLLAHAPFLNSAGRGIQSS